jgi:hypothetical protein
MRCTEENFLWHAGINVIPGKGRVFLSLAKIFTGIDPALGEGLLPEIKLEVFRPGIEARA